MFRCWMGLICLILLLAPAPAAAGDGGGPILVGGTVSRHGKFREPGTMVEQGYRLWERQINEQGGLLGRPVKLIVYDDRSDPARTRQLYQRLLTRDHVDLLLSPYSTTLTLAASAVSERFHYVMLACGASGEEIWQRGYHYIFGVYAPSGRYFIGLLDLMARYGLDSVVVLYEFSPFNVSASRGVEKWSKRFGVRVLMNAVYLNGKRSLKKLLPAVRQANPAGLILCSYPDDDYLLLKLLKKTGYRPRVLAMTIGPVLPDFVRRAGAQAEGVFAPSQWEPDTRLPFPGSKEFIKEFQSFTGRLPSYHAAAAYASCQLLARGVATIRCLDQIRLRKHIASLDTITIIGRFKVDSSGMQIGHNPILIQWQHGRKVIVYPAKLRTAVPRF